jgi:hypothetical protein
VAAAARFGIDPFTPVGVFPVSPLSNFAWRQLASPACRTSNSSPSTGTVLGARELGPPDWPSGSVIYTGPNEPNLRVVRELDTENDDPEMHFTVLVVEPTSD